MPSPKSVIIRKLPFTIWQEGYPIVIIAFSMPRFGIISLAPAPPSKSLHMIQNWDALHGIWRRSDPKNSLSGLIPCILSVFQRFLPQVVVPFWPRYRLKSPAEERMLRLQKEHGRAFLELAWRFPAIFPSTIFYVFQDPYGRQQTWPSDIGDRDVHKIITLSSYGTSFL